MDASGPSSAAVWSAAVVVDSPAPAVGNFIDGRWLRPANERYLVRTDPADVTQTVVSAPRSDGEDVRAAVASAKHAFLEWSTTPAPQRGRILGNTAAILRERANGIAWDITREEGKTLAEARGEVVAAADLLTFVAGEAQRLGGQHSESNDRGATVFTRRRPFGVAALITPFNFPVLNPCAQIGAALAAGNTVVLKPASITPVSAAHIALAFSDAGLPDGALNLVFGEGGRIGTALVQHESVATASFTGSEESVRALRGIAAARGIPLQFELGGKNAIVVMPDADLRSATTAAVGGAFGCTGQRCNATSRVIAVGNVAGALLDEIAEATGELRVGSGFDPTVSVGPQADEPLLAHTDSLVKGAIDQGARVRAGGRRAEGDEWRRGHFFLPTVLDQVDPNMPVAQEEVFGPVLALIEAADLDDAVRIVNGTRYGASAAIFTGSLRHAWRFIDGCEVGLVKVNEMTPGLEPHVPFAGWKATGSGHAALGSEGVHAYTRIQAVKIRHGA